MRSFVSRRDRIACHASRAVLGMSSHAGQNAPSPVRNQMPTSDALAVAYAERWMRRTARCTLRATLAARSRAPRIGTSRSWIAISPRVWARYTPSTLPSSSSMLSTPRAYCVFKLSVARLRSGSEARVALLAAKPGASMRAVSHAMRSGAPDAPLPQASGHTNRAPCVQSRDSPAPESENRPLERQADARTRAVRKRRCRRRAGVSCRRPGAVRTAGAGIRAWRRGPTALLRQIILIG